MTTLEVAFKKIGYKAPKSKIRWPRARYGTRGQTRRKGGIKNLHFVVQGE